MQTKPVWHFRVFDSLLRKRSHPPINGAAMFILGATPSIKRRCPLHKAPSPRPRQSLGHRREMLRHAAALLEGRKNFLKK